MEEETFLLGFNNYCLTLHTMKRGGCCTGEKKSFFCIDVDSQKIFDMNLKSYFWYENWLLKE